MRKNIIADSIKKIAKEDEEIYSIVCKAKNINLTELKCDCSPIDGSADILEVRLMAEANTGFLIVPKNNSTVIVTMLNKFTGYVSMFSEIDEIRLNGDNYDGLVKISDLITKLNNLENKVNIIINTFNAHTHPYVNVSTPATTSPSATPVVGTLTPTQQVELENQTVKHGNG